MVRNRFLPKKGTGWPQPDSAFPKKLFQQHAWRNRIGAFQAQQFFPAAFGASFWLGRREADGDHRPLLLFAQAGLYTLYT